MDGFELCHPGPTSRDGRGYPVLGVDGPGDPDDANYRLCAQCGYPALKGRDSSGDSFDSPGLQAVTTAVPISPAQGGGTVNVIEEQVVGGCPLCGSLNYEGFNRMRWTPARNPRTRR